MTEPSAKPGAAPTARDRSLGEAAAELAPHHSLARIDATAKFVLATVALVGSLLTGFGALGSTVVADHPVWALPSLVLAAISIALATLAVVGRNDEVNVDDLNDVGRYYEDEIERRGTMICWAGFALAAALLLAALPLIRSATTSGEAPASKSPGSSAGAVSPSLQPPRSDAQR